LAAWIASSQKCRNAAAVRRVPSRMSETWAAIAATLTIAADGPGGADRALIGRRWSARKKAA
jgi:hypothetical protein